MFKQTTIFLLTILYLTASAFAENFVNSVVGTGQTKCYDDEKVIPCPKPGEPFYGQDANYTINPPMTFAKLDGKGNPLPDDVKEWSMVKDINTGLIWEGKSDDGSIHDKVNKYNWQDAQDVFISKLNKEKFGGYSDWRLPTTEELRNINYYDKCDPSIDKTYFPNTVTILYWCSTEAANSINSAWGVGFYCGHDSGSVLKWSSWPVRAVRGIQVQSFDNLINNGDGTVTDKNTHLIWQQEEAGKMTWKNALAYCENLKLAGKDDWRLPTIKELESLTQLNKFEPALDKKYFPNIGSSYNGSSYWSSTTAAYDTSYAWQVQFYSGTLSGAKKSDSYYVRAVRGRQGR